MRSVWDVSIQDISDDLAAVALQGPRARAILHDAAGGVADDLRFFWMTSGVLAGVPVEITRTGYTGDLGYEIWTEPAHAEALWDGLIAAGEAHGILPAGMLALDLARVEAGLILIGVDYVPAHWALIEDQKSSPFELGLDWAVKLDKKSFVGRDALLAEKERGRSGSSEASTWIGIRSRGCTARWGCRPSSQRRAGAPVFLCTRGTPRSDMRRVAVGLPF